MKNKKRNYLIYIIAMLIPFAAMFMHMIIRKCYPFGDYSILTGDANYQYVRFYNELIDVIKDGKGLFFNFDSGMGYDFYSNFWYYLANPLNIIIVLGGKANVEITATIVLLIEMCLCAFSANYYFRHTKHNHISHGKVNDLLCLLLAAAYSLCDYMLAYSHNMLWMPALILAPFMMLGIEHLVDRNDGRLYGITLLLAFITNFYFAWFLCVFAVIWFFDQRKENLKICLKRLGKFLLISVLSALSSAIILVPCYLSVLGRTDSQNSWDEHTIGEFGKICNFIQGFFFAHAVDEGGYSTYVNNNYLGIFAFFLCVLYIFSKVDEKKQKIKRIGELLFIVIAMNWSVLNWIFHGFSFTHSSGNRFAFMLVIIMLVCAMEILSKIQNVKLVNLILAAVSVVGLCVVGLLDNSQVETITSYLVTFLVVFYLIICFILMVRKSIKPKSIYINIIVISFIELFANVYFNGDYSLYDDRAANSKVFGADYEAIDTNIGERKTSLIEDNMNFYYSQTDIFSSCYLKAMSDSFAKLGMTYKKIGGSYVYRGVTPLTASLYNVRYVLTDKPYLFGGYSETKTGDNYSLYENDFAAGFGFMLPLKAESWNLEAENPFENQNNFTREVLGVGDIFTKQDIKDASYTAQNAFVLSHEDNAVNYTNYAFEGSTACVEMYFKSPEDLDLYVYTHDTTTSYVLVYLSKDRKYDTSEMSDGDMLHIGKMKKGEEAMIVVFNNSLTGSNGTSYIDLYSYNEEVMKQCYNIITEQPFELTDFENNKITGDILAKEDGILYLSLPHYKGFKVMVNGEKGELVDVAGAMLGVKVKAGENHVVITYRPYGFFVGLIISIVGIISFVLWALVVKRKKIKQKKDKAK